MRRRTFITATALIITLGPNTLRAQAPKRVFRVGYIGLSGRSTDPQWTAFHDEIRGLGYVEGQNLVIERRYVQGRHEAVGSLVAELLHGNVDVLVTTHSGAARAAKQATSTVPIVLAGVSNPERSGLVDSLARPGGNVTGVSNIFGETSEKIVELFKEALPHRSRLGILSVPTNPGDAFGSERLETAARTLRVTLIWERVRDAEDLDRALTAVVRQRAEAVYASQSLIAQQAKIGDFAMANRMPLLARSRHWVSALLTYGVSWPDIFRLVARYVGQVLNGANPADLPVQQPTKLEIVVNMRIAKALGLTIPASLLARADEVIE